jgi:hypothetical protein
VPISNFKRYDATNRRLKFDVASADYWTTTSFLESFCNANTEFDAGVFSDAYHLLYPTCTYRFDRFDSRKVILKNKNLILIKHLFVKHMERVARMKRQDNKRSTIYLLSSFLVHHKSMNIPKALSNTKSNVTIRTPYSHSRSSKVTGLNTAHDTLQRFFVWYPVNKLSSWQSYAAIQRTATRDLIHKACGNSAIAESLRTFQAKLMRRLRKSYAIFTKPPLTLRNLRKVFATTVRKTSNIGQPRQFSHLQGESSKDIEKKSAHFLA